MSVTLSADHVVSASGVLAPGWVEASDGFIDAMGSGPAPTGATHLSGYLVPGFVDMHTHGGGGASVVGGDPTAVRTFADTHRRFGTTAIIASLVSGHQDQLVADVIQLADLAEQGVIAGIHLEGPWISPKYKGAHDPTALRAPQAAEVAELLAAGRGYVRMVTIAPELQGAPTAIEQLTAAGVVSAVGHTNASYEEVRSAIEAGATVATHLFNAMRPISHRAPGPIVALTEDPRVTVELILDGIHLHPAVGSFGRRAAEGRVALITDAMGAAGAGDGDYMLGELAVSVVEGVARLVEGGAIAGSTLTMDRAFAFAVQQCGFSVAEAAVAASTTPARLMGLAEVTGAIDVGLRADLCHLDADLALQGVWAAGRPVQR